MRVTEEQRVQYIQGVNVVRSAVEDVRRGLADGDDPVELAVDLATDFREKLHPDQLAGSIAIALVLLAWEGRQ